MVHRLSCSVACGIVPDQGSFDPMSPALAGRFFTTDPSRKPLNSHFKDKIKYLVQSGKLSDRA